MFRARTSSVIKFIISIFITALISSAFMIGVYKFLEGKKKNSIIMSQEEALITQRHDRENTKYRLYSYPQTDFSSYINWLDDKNSCLSIAFPNGVSEFAGGLYLTLTVNLSPYLEDGRLEFFVKADTDSVKETELYVYLQEGPKKDKMVVRSLPLILSSTWQKVSLPLNQFSTLEKEIAIAGNESFSWEIQGFLFALKMANRKQKVELRIRGLTVTEAEDVIYVIL